MGQLEGKCAIVTGATSGIGRRTVERFVEEGARVVFCGRRETLGAQLQAALGRERACFVKADVTLEADVARVIGTCVISCSTTPAARRRPAESSPLRWRDSTPPWRPWCAA
jgi:NAD(P)-dependent dehydrogenase (short-subunit alcohol dehydrogenase family)